MLTVGCATLAVWEVPDLRQRLAHALAFSRRYHRQPYCLATLPTEIGAKVRPFRDDALTLPAFIVTEDGRPLIRVNELLYGSPLHPLAVLHECSHYVLGHRTADCTDKMESRDERDVWLASALVGVSAPLIRLVLDGHESASEIAWRCRVPEPLVLIRAGLAVVLGERPGPIGEALDLIRYQLGRLESWIEGMKRWLCRRDRTA